MSSKNKDGLRYLLLPYDIAGLILAVLGVGWSGCRGLLVLPVFLGWWLCGFAGTLLLVIFVFWLISLTVDMKQPPPMEDHPFHRAIVIYVIGLLNRLGRVRIHFDDLDKLPAGRFVVVSNHRSGYDPIVSVWAMRKRRVTFITKPENLKIPIAGPMIYQSNFLPIDRENPRNAMETINNAAALLKNDVVSVGVYPEGTRGHGGELLPFHNGVFKIAQKAGVPLVVAVIEGTERIMKSTPWRHTDVYLRVCEVIPPEELGSGTAALGERVRGTIGAALGKSEKVLT